jgi:hypothetical protein
MLVYDDLRSASKIPRSRVIAEALPGVEDVLFRSVSECSEIRKPV